MGSGWFGAPQVGVVGMIIVSYMGISLASASGSHFRPKFADPLLLRWNDTANRIGEFGFALFCFFMAYIAFKVSLESHQLEDVSAVLRWPIWPIQGVIMMGFFLVAVRHTIYGVFINLRPEDAKNISGFTHFKNEYYRHSRCIYFLGILFLGWWRTNECCL
jgi:TRAP-type C4-dicarboxylate transport system permease small subunit